MRAVVQRVSESSVAVGPEVVGRIGRGLLVLLGVAKTDTEKECDYLAEKIVNLRIFEDEGGRLNRSLIEVGGEVLIVSQFTLLADCRKGRRPSFTDAAPPGDARKLYDYFAGAARSRGLKVATGIFQALMEVELVNIGPVTILLDSSKNF